PGGQKARDRVRRDGLNLAAEGRQRAAPQRTKDLWVAVLAALGRLAERPRSEPAFRGKTRERRLDRGARQGPPLGRVGGDEWDMRARVPPQQRFEGIRAGVEEDFGEADREARADGLAIPSGVLGCDPAGLTSDPARVCEALLLEHKQTSRA